MCPILSIVASCRFYYSPQLANIANDCTEQSSGSLHTYKTESKIVFEGTFLVNTFGIPDEQEERFIILRMYLYPK